MACGNLGRTPWGPPSLFLTPCQHSDRISAMEKPVVADDDIQWRVDELRAAGAYRSALVYLRYLHRRERLVAYDTYDDGQPVVIRERVAA